MGGGHDIFRDPPDKIGIYSSTWTKTGIFLTPSGRIYFFFRTALFTHFTPSDSFILTILPLRHFSTILPPDVFFLRHPRTKEKKIPAWTGRFDPSPLDKKAISSTPSSLFNGIALTKIGDLWGKKWNGRPSWVIHPSQLNQNLVPTVYANPCSSRTTIFTLII